MEIVCELIAGHRASGISSPELPFYPPLPDQSPLISVPWMFCLPALKNKLRCYLPRWSCLSPLTVCAELWWLVYWKDQCRRYWSTASKILYLHIQWWYYGPVIDLKPFNGCTRWSHRMERSGLLDKAPPKMDERIRRTQPDGAACANQILY